MSKRRSIVNDPGISLDMDPAILTALRANGVLPRCGRARRIAPDTVRAYLSEAQLEAAATTLASALGLDDEDGAGERAAWVRRHLFDDYLDVFRQSACIIECIATDREMEAAAR